MSSTAFFPEQLLNTVWGKIFLKYQGCLRDFYSNHETYQIYMVTSRAVSVSELQSALEWNVKANRELVIQEPLTLFTV